ncbi:MAG: hypothetical protein QOE77_1552 [Blastocatellia bacterium]|jgi:hypothetical protein|nr:hypothetical protein [Blastocatellia bacterium]
MKQLADSPSIRTPHSAFRNRTAGTFVICLLFSLVMVYHFVVPLDAVLASEGKVWNDPAHSIWSLWLVTENISSGRSPYHTDRIFYPVGADLTHHTLSPGFFPVTFLVKKLSRNAPMYPIYAYRIIVWLCFTLLLYFQYLLLRQLQFTRLAAAIGGVAFAFADFFHEHSPHLSLLAGFFIPLTALCLVRLYRRTSSRNLVVAGLSLGMAIYFTELALYIVLALTVFLLAASLHRSHRTILKEKIRALGMRRILLTGALSVAIMMPFLLNHFSSKVIKPPVMESSNYSANLAGFVIPEPNRTPLYGNMFAALSARLTKGSDGRETFIGFPVLLFAIVGLLALKDRMIRVAATVALVFLILSLGPTLKMFGTETSVPLPYALLMKLPPFDLGRTPIRFVVIAIFFLTIIAGAGLTWTQTTLQSAKGSKAALTLLLLVFLWTATEAYWPFPRQMPFHPPAELAQIVAGPVLNLPASRFDGYAALLQVFHHQPIATGYISRFSEEQVAQVENLARVVDKESDACSELARQGIRNLIMNPVPYLEAPYHFGSCPLNILDLRLKASYSRYEMGARIDLSSASSERFLGYGWSPGEPNARWTERGKAIVYFALDQPQIVTSRTSPSRAASLLLRMAPFLAAGKLDHQRVIIKMNGHELQTLTLATNETIEYSVPVGAGLLGIENVLSLELPDAESPKRLGVGEDTRRLGVSVQWLQLDPAVEPFQALHWDRGRPARN